MLLVLINTRKRRKEEKTKNFNNRQVTTKVRKVTRYQGTYKMRFETFTLLSAATLNQVTTSMSVKNALQ